MAGEMKLYEQSDFLALVPGSAVAKAMAMNRDDGDEFSEMDLVQVKTPSGGGNHWSLKGATGTEMLPYLEGVVVFRCKKGILWPKDETGTDKPVLVSDDMKVAKLMIPWEEVPDHMKLVLPAHELTEAEVRSDTRYANVPKETLPRLFWWDGPNRIPYCEFGSSTKPGSKGKKAKDYQIIYLLRKNEGLPVRLQLGPTSIQPVRQFFNGMTDLPMVRAFIKLSLKEKVNDAGQKYSVLVLERTGTLSEETGALIEEKYRNPIKRAYEAGKLNLIPGEDTDD